MRQIQNEIFQKQCHINALIAKQKALADVIEDLKLRIASLEGDRKKAIDDLNTLIEEQNETKD